MANTTTNAMTAKIVDYRFIGKTQLNADDMGGVGCKTWEDYLKVCNLLTTSAWDYTMGKSIDDNVVNAAISGLFAFFGIKVTDTRKYTARILSVMVERKPKRSDALKDALKAKKNAKTAWEEAIANERPAEEVANLKTAYESADATVNQLYGQPNNYWFDHAPMFDKKNGKAKPSARKALEDTCADIFNERKFMSADEIQKEEQALADQRKGRKIRQKEEAKQAKSESANK